MLTRTFDSAICGYHYYRKCWSPKIKENLICSHERNNAFDKSAIKTCKEDGEIVSHLPNELSCTLKFLLDRGAKISAVLMSTHYRRSPLVQGGMEIPCKVTFEMSLTLKNMQLMDHLMELIKTLYKPHSPMILGSFLPDKVGVEFLSNETGQKSLKTRKEERTNEKSECNKIIQYQRNLLLSRSKEAMS